MPTCGSRCSDDLYQNGQPVLMVQGPRASTIEDWVQLVARVSGQRVDWHFVGGYARVVCLGDRDRVVQAASNLRVVLDEMYEDCPDNWCGGAHNLKYITVVEIGRTDPTRQLEASNIPQ